MPDSEEYTWQRHQLISRKAMVLQRDLLDSLNNVHARLLLAAGLPDFYWSYAVRLLQKCFVIKH